MASIAPAAIAQAQTTPPAAAEVAPAPASAEQASDQDIIVTGSRVVSNGNDSPSPVTVVSIQQIAEVKPGTVADQLNELPQFSGSQGQTSAVGAGSANAGNPNGNGNVLNLRNFGVTRNLILFDGHRVAPNSPGGTVDIDLIPQLLLQRVDIVTGGASAVYGADAVTGVVNFVTDTKFTGVKLNAFGGVSSRGDGGTQDIGVAWGGNIGSRAHLLLSYQYRNDDGIDNRSAREWGRSRYAIGSAGPAVNGVTTQRFVSDAGRPGASFGGTISSIGTPANPFANTYFIAPGVLAPVTGVAIGNNSNIAGNSSGSYFDQSLKGRLELHQGFGRFDYEVAEGLKFYVRGAYTETENGAFGVSNPTYQASNSSNVHAVFVSNPYLPTAIASQMSALGITRFGINKVHSGPTMDEYRQFTESFGRNYSIDAGFNGSFGNGWRWEASYIHSANRLHTRQANAINGRKLAAALDAVTTPTGIQCYVSTQPAFAALYPGCVPYASAFGPSITAAEADYLFDPIEVTTKTNMDDVEGFISGSPFSTWAGPVNLAISGQGRKQSYQVISGREPASLANPLDCSGLRLISCTGTSLEYFQAESASRSKISVAVKEAAIEGVVPLLRDFVLARSLAVSGAYRITDYSTSGTVSSWKAGIDWKVNDELSFRGTRSRDIRAPTMHELFAPISVANFNAQDQLLGISLDGSSGRPNPAGQVNSGNEALRPELSDTLTVGAVYRPSFVPGLSIALDYFDIRVKDAIITYSGADAATQLDCINSGGTSATCALIVRPIDCCSTKTFGNAITRVFSRPINIGRQFTRGADLELNYVNTVFNRRFNLRTLVSYQPKNVLVDALSGLETNVAGSSAGVAAVAGHAKWRGTLIASMDVTDNVRFSLQERYRGKMNWYPTYAGGTAPQFTLLDAPKNVPARFYTNVNLALKSGQSEFFLNVQNLFDQAPAPYANVTAPFPNPTIAPGDDAVGRYFTAGVRIRM